jgi:hypothetical protein
MESIKGSTVMELNVALSIADEAIFPTSGRRLTPVEIVILQVVVSCFFCGLKLHPGNCCND